MNHAQAIDLNSDRLVALPQDAKKDSTMESVLTVVAWMQKEHLDAFYSTLDGLVGIGMNLKPVSNSDWDGMIPSQLEKAFADVTSVPLSKLSITQGTTVPVTRAFKTREGGMGVLQVVGFSDNPRGVKIRYKLVQDSAAIGSVRTRMLGMSSQERTTKSSPTSREAEHC